MADASISADINTKRRPRVQRLRKDRGRTRTWPTPSQLRDLVVPEPEPVLLYVGRFPASLRWREDLETFTVRIRGRDQDGNPKGLVVGTEVSQFPTVEGLLQAVAAKGQAINAESRRQAIAYERKSYRRYGTARFQFDQHDGTYRLRLMTPLGKSVEIQPARQRDDRSRGFGPVMAFNQISRGDHQEVALELARLMLEMVDSTSRDPDRLLSDAKELAVDVQRWGRSFSVKAADVSRWTHTRQPIRSANPTDLSTAPTPATQRPNSERRLSVTRETSGRLGGRTVKITVHRQPIAGDEGPVPHQQPMSDESRNPSDEKRPVRKPTRPEPIAPAP